MAVLLLLVLLLRSIAGGGSASDGQTACATPPVATAADNGNFPCCPQAAASYVELCAGVITACTSSKPPLHPCDCDADGTIVAANGTGVETGRPGCAPHTSTWSVQLNLVLRIIAVPLPGYWAGTPRTADGTNVYTWYA
jgi:hypothetical protein